MLKRVAKYLRKLVAEKDNSALLTKEDFFARIEKAKKQPGKSFSNVDELERYINSL